MANNSKPEIPFGIDPVSYFNFYVPFPDIFKDEKAVHMKSNTEACYPNPEDLQDNINSPTFVLRQDNSVSVLKSNPFKMVSGSIVSKFMVYCAVKFKGDYRGAMSHVEYKMMGVDVPYIRVGCDYYLIDEKPSRWGINRSLIRYKKEAITDDHTKSMLKFIPKYTGFCIEPDNVSYKFIHGRYCNLYSEFPHTPHPSQVSVSQIPTTIHLMRHIFGDDKFDVGMKYMKILYENPKQILPILVLVSEERETGKTTFLNWIQMLFGENSISISPNNITSDFNSSYATKNIILIDEALIERSIGTEKLKAIATAKTVTVNPKHVDPYSIPFFGKIIMCSNKELDFAKIDNAEIRFFVRKVDQITGTRNVKIESHLMDEIPKFIRYLSDMPPVDFSKSRMVFTKEEIGTKELTAVKEESQTHLYKELKDKIAHWFMNHPNNDDLFALPDDIKEEWFLRQSNVTPDWIRRVLKQEFKLLPEPPCWYFPINNAGKVKGRPFKFNVKKFLLEQDMQVRSEHSEPLEQL